jgi:hypothetical protein
MVSLERTDLIETLSRLQEWLEESAGAWPHFVFYDYWAIAVGNAIKELCNKDANNGPHEQSQED